MFTRSGSVSGRGAGRTLSAGSSTPAAYTCMLRDTRIRLIDTVHACDDAIMRLRAMERPLVLGFDAEWRPVKGSKVSLLQVSQWGMNIGPKRSTGCHYELYKLHQNRTVFVPCADLRLTYHPVDPTASPPVHASAASTAAGGWRCAQGRCGLPS